MSDAREGLRQPAAPCPLTQARRGSDELRTRRDQDGVR